ARPPPAVPGCALSRGDLQKTPTETPMDEASIAALNPAPPAPITSTSYGCVWYSGIQTILQSVHMPIAHKRTYTSENMTDVRLIHAHNMWRRVRQLEQS